MIAARAPVAAKAIRVVVVEHQTLFATALCTVLAGDATLAVAGGAATVDPSLLHRARPAVILLDADLPSIDLEATIDLCREHAADAGVCILSMRSEPSLMRRWMQAGARGYVLKAAMPAELCRAIRLIAGGASYVDPRLAGAPSAAQNGRSRAESPDELTEREIEVLRALAQGLTNKEIGVRLRLSEKTVKNILSRIFSKLQLRSRAQAAVHAVKHGLG